MMRTRKIGDNLGENDKEVSGEADFTPEVMSVLNLQ